MRHNGCAPLLASKIPANDLEVRPGETPTVVCPGCQSWKIVRRGMVFPHDHVDTRKRCSGSGQRILIDVPLALLEARQLADTAQTGTRRPTRVQLKPTTPVTVPVFRLAPR